MELIIGLTVITLGGYITYKWAAAINNDVVVYTLLIGLSTILPMVGLPLLITVLVCNMIVPVAVSMGLVSAQAGLGVEKSVSNGLLMSGAIGMMIIGSLYFGVVLSWISFGVLTNVVSLILIINNIRIAIKDYGAGVATLQTITITIIASLVILVSNLFGISNLIAIVCVIFGLLPGGRMIGNKQNKIVKRYETNSNKEEISVIGSLKDLILSTSLAIGGVNPYLLLNGKQSLLSVITIGIAAELVPLGKWIAGQDTGKTFITELLKTQTIDSTGVILLLSTIVAVGIMLLLGFMMKDLVIASVRKYVNHNENVKKDTSVTDNDTYQQLTDALIVFFLGAYSGFLPGLVALGIFLIFRLLGDKFQTLIPPALSTTLPCLIISLS